MGADAVAHGATGKGNDQVRFELTYYALKPDIKIIAPWREWDLTSRTKLLEFAEATPDPHREGQAGRSAILGGRQSSAFVLRRQSAGRPGGRGRLHRLSAHAVAGRRAGQGDHIEIGFEKGDAVSIDGVALSPATLLTRLNELGRANGIGRIDLVENRFVGMKSRGVYETPGGTILLTAHRAMESHHARPRRGPPEGRADAALCGADL